MKKLIPYIPRLFVRIGITILWACLRLVVAIFGVFAKWLQEKMNKPI